MTPARTAVTILILAVAPAPGQLPSGPAKALIGYAVKKCIDPKVPIGRLPNATGTVSLVLGKDGRPDTLSIAVLQVAGISVSGFCSAAVRRLSACQYEIKGSAAKTLVGVVLTVTTNDTAVQAGVATPTGTPGFPLAMEPVEISRDSFPLPLDDPRLEERPRRLHCGNSSPRLVPRDRIVEWSSASMGSLRAEVLVASDGKPNRRVKIIWTSNPPATRDLVNWMVGCEFVPGRYRGIAVPAFVLDSIGLVATKRP